MAANLNPGAKSAGVDYIGLGCVDKVCEGRLPKGSIQMFGLGDSSGCVCSRVRGDSTHESEPQAVRFSPLHQRFKGLVRTYLIHRNQRIPLMIYIETRGFVYNTYAQKQGDSWML